MYTVKILSNAEFDKLPFKRAKEALGAADVKTGIAYVRDTGYNDITKRTIEHELDELMQEVSPHEEDGIRYKLGSSLGSLFSSIGSSIGKGAASIGNFLTPGPEIFGSAAKAGAGAASGLGFGTSGPSFQGITGALGGSGAPLSSAGGLGFTSSLPNLAGAGQIASGGLAQGVKGAASGIFDNFASGIAGLLPGAGTAAPPGFTNKNPFITDPLGIDTTSTFADFVTQGAQANQPSFIDKILSFGKNQLFGSPTGDSVGGSGTEEGFLNQIFGEFKKQAPALAISGIGQLLAPKVDAPDVSGVTDDLRSRITGDTLSPLFEQGAGEINRILGAPIDAPPESAFIRGDELISRNTEDRIDALRTQFKRTNPNADVENNSAFLEESQRIQQEAAEQRAAIRDEISFQFEREQLQRRLQATQLALNLDSAQIDQLIRIAQADIDAIGLQFGLDLKEAQEFKDLFSKFGGLLGQQATNTQEEE